MAPRGNSGRLLIADDQVTARLGTIQVLTDGGHNVCAAVDDPDVLLDHVEQHDPDLVVVEPIMGDSDRVAQCLGQLASRHPDLPIIAFTSQLNGAVVLTALAAGCRGVLPKTATAEHLLAAVHDVLQGGRHLHPRALALALEQRRPLASTAPARTLSPRELSIVSLTADGLTNREIGETLGIGAETVKTHLANAQSKLQARDRTHLVAQAWRAGLLS